MSYVVLARKWRPKTFDEIVGQEHITRTLKNALLHNRIGHAYIFAGPRGVGKTTTARLLATYVNQEKLTEEDFLHPFADDAGDVQNLDVIEVDGASNRGIDEIRNLRENVRFAPTVSKYKVYIIDEVHMLSKEAFNALLKTLEEPPGHVMFIFATTEIHKVPLTILSRCQRFDFKRIPTPAIAEQLKCIAAAESIEIDEESLFLIARKAEGGLRDATSMLDQLSSFCGGNITLEAAREALGVLDDELFFQYSQLMLQKDDGQILAYVRKIFEKGHDVLNFIQGLAEHFRNLLLVAATGEEHHLETSDYYRKLYKEKAVNFHQKDLLHYLDLIIQHESQIKYSENPQLMLELLLLKLAHKPSVVDIQELLELLKKTPQPVASAPAAEKKNEFSAPQVEAPPPAPKISPPPSPVQVKEPVPEKSPGETFSSLKNLKLPTAKSVQKETSPAPETSKTAAEISLSIDEVIKEWESVVNAVKQEKIALASFLLDGVPKGIKGNIIEIAFDKTNEFHMAHVQKNTRTINRIMSAYFNQEVAIECVQCDFRSEGIREQIKSPEEKFESLKSKEPVLKRIIDLFDCETLD